MAKSTLYRCPDCGHVCTEAQMNADVMPAMGDEDESWSNWICPNCKRWHVDVSSWGRLPLTYENAAGLGGMNLGPGVVLRGHLELPDLKVDANATRRDDDEEPS